MSLARRLSVGHLADRQFQHPLGSLVPTFDGGWLVSFQECSEIRILDSRLDDIQCLVLHTESEPLLRPIIAMSRDGHLIAMDTRSVLHIYDRGGTILHRIPHDPWVCWVGGDCCFDGKNRLWYVRPGSIPGKNDSLVVVEPDSGANIVEQDIENPVGHFNLFLCPDQEGMLIELACGQDGTSLYRASLIANKMTIWEYPFADRCFCGGFSPNGCEFVTGAHDSDRVMVHAFPDGHVTDFIEDKTLFADDDFPGMNRDRVRYEAIFLDASHILAQTHSGRMALLQRMGMKVLGSVWPDGYRLHTYDRSWKETTDPAEIACCQGSLTSIRYAGPQTALAMFNNNQIKLLDFSPLLMDRSPLR